MTMLSIVEPILLVVILAVLGTLVQLRKITTGLSILGWALGQVPSDPPGGGSVTNGRRSPGSGQAASDGGLGPKGRAADTGPGAPGAMLTTAIIFTVLVAAWGHSGAIAERIGRRQHDR